MIKSFPTLYKLTSTGDIQQWDVAVEGSTIRTSWGRKGGTIQVTEDIITEGKNIGKANETSAEEQALAEAEATWTKKLKKDYAETEKDAMAGKASSLVEGGILPMLAHKFSEHGDKLKYPCAVQKKYVGKQLTVQYQGITKYGKLRFPVALRFRQEF